MNPEEEEKLKKILASEEEKSKKFEEQQKNKEILLEEKKKAILAKIQSHFLDFLQLAENFIQEQPVFYDKNNMFWMWNIKNNRWEITDETEILNLFDEGTEINDTVDSKTKNKIIEALRRVGRKNIPKEIKPTWIQFKNKIIDIENLEEKEINQEYFVTNPISWEIGETEETPVIDKLFTEWVGEEYVLTLYQIIAYCMIPSYFLHRIFCLMGAGMNGKGKYLELICKFIGKHNVTSTDLDVLMDSRFERTKLHKKLVCQMGETNFNVMAKTAFLKRLTGGDLVGFEYKNKLPFDDYNYAKILIATNSLPQTKDKTLGFYRRWMIIDFPNQFDEKKDILESIPEVEYNNLAKKSVRLLHELYLNREFHKEGSLQEREQKFEDASNPLQKFLKEKTEKDPQGHIFKFEFKDAFIGWQKDEGFRVWSEKEISLAMKDVFEDGRIAATEYRDGKFEVVRWWAWLGIVWSERRENKPSGKGGKDVNSEPTHILYKGGSGTMVDMLDNPDQLINSTIPASENGYQKVDATHLPCQKCGLIQENGLTFNDNGKAICDLCADITGQQN